MTVLFCFPISFEARGGLGLGPALWGGIEKVTEYFTHEYLLPL